MDYIIAAIENALTAGRWRDAAPLLSDILSNGTTCQLKSLEHYERLAGQECNDPNVRFHLTSRLRMVDDRNWCASASQRREAERLAYIVREHGNPCRVVKVADVGYQLRVASSVQKPVRKWRGEGTRYWSWDIAYIKPFEATVMAWLGY